MNKKTTMGFVTILAVGLSGSGAAETSRDRLSAARIKGLRDIGQAVLVSRKKQREEVNNSELRKKVQQYHESLVRLRSGMSKTIPNASTAWSVDSASGKLMREKAAKAKRNESHDRLIDAAIEARKALYAAFDEPKGSSKGKREHFRFPNRAALRKKMEEHGVELDQLKKKGLRRRLEIISGLVERTKGKGKKPGSNRFDAPLSGRGDPKRHRPTPTITVLTRHRHQ
uniref:Uncharacterized protein n=1 Tax=Candidatus Kentrum sp. TC TaxID=2126339 RepID=A0A450Z267_9GAMM|nr:MAG: hypothetical protein BECKTC1821D_GA0114238_105211 [Candidatus Kentron sp. TC]VFK61126.1 MAG: hypothetical protein BECKTC1821F_GA0114240_10542 [Candidatus Kentron sp. TC]